MTAPGDFSDDPLLVTDDDFGAFDMHNPPKLYPGIYLLYDAQDEIIYVGESGDVPRRMKEHKRSKKWFSDVRKIESLFCSDPSTRLIIETLQIFRHRPRYNRAIKIGLSKKKFYSIQFIRGRRG